MEDLTKTNTGAVQVPNSEVPSNGTAGTVEIDVAALQAEKLKKLEEFMIANGISKDEVQDALQIKIPDKAMRPLRFMPSFEDLEFLYNCKEKNITLETAIKTLNTKRRILYKEVKGVIHTLEFISKNQWKLDGGTVFESNTAAADELAGNGKSISGPVFWEFTKSDFDKLNK